MSREESQQTPPELPARILVVDDEQPVRSALTRLLAFDNYHILQASDGQRALEILQDNEVDVIITDYHMGGMNGVELLRSVINHDPTITRILFSGHIDVDLIREAVNDGDVNHFITKPWDNDEMLLAVRQCAGRTTWLREQQHAEKASRHRTQLLEINNHQLHDKVRNSHHALQLSQDILDKLPVIVVGIDSTGCIALANALARHCFPELIPGDPCTTCLPNTLHNWFREPDVSRLNGTIIELHTGVWRFEALSLDKRGLIFTGQPHHEHLEPISGVNKAIGGHRG